MIARRYVAPPDFKQALETQIRRRAQEQGIDIARVRQRCVFERFLARLSAHLGDRVTLKGGVVLTLRLARGRMTKDVDLRVSGAPDRLLEDLRRAGQIAMGPDFLTFEVDPDPEKPTIDAQGMAYQGQRFRAEARLAGKIYGSRFGVDVAFGSSMALPAEVVVGSDLFVFAGIAPVMIRAYAREVHLAEKLHALTMPRPSENSRVRDLPDVALLATTGPFESTALRDAIQATFVQRATHEPPDGLPAPPDGWRAPYARLAQQNALPWTSLEEVFESARAFLDPVLRGEDGLWDIESWSWRRSA